MSPPASPPRLSDRELNRALMARQLLLERSDLGVVPAVEHLVGVQAQTPFTPYVSLWSRLDGFTTDHLADAMTGRKVVRIATLRSTIHLHTGRDALTVRTLTDEVGRRMLQSSRGKGLVDLDLDSVGAAARAILEDEPMLLSALGERLAPQWPDRNPEHLATASRCVLPLVQPPPRGVWGRSGGAVHTTAESFLGRQPPARPSLKTLIRRYVGAYGPAGVRDAQLWSGLTGLAPVFEQLRPELIVFTDPVGREVFDLPDAPRPSADAPAPVRYLGDLDNVWLSHFERTRVMDPARRPSLMSSIGANRGTFLVDGFIAGMWRLRATKGGAVLGLDPFDRLRTADKHDLEREGRALLSMLVPEQAEAADVRFDGLA